MKARFETYRPKRILNVRKHADHWFWTRYSAYPYVGCQHGCAFCYCRERKYASHDDPADFSRLIRIKEDAPEMLRRESTRAAPIYNRCLSISSLILRTNPASVRAVA
ncbi:MAG: hypothetical protein SVX38_06900, partial [Chloroflexota bacterium]|nr:hypothetical protein [Chloroflexota bacterium]